MKVVRSKKAGFCMGVALALHKLDALVLQGGSVATLGPIIHNPQVLAEYAVKGVRCLNAPEDAVDGMHVLIRAHGVPRSVEASLCARGSVHCVDATCPRVKEAQNAIFNATAGGETLLLYGDANHPEVEGLISYAQGAVCVAVEPDELVARAGGEGFFVLAAQTTQDRSTFDAIKSRLLPLLGCRIQVLDTICDATRQRQQEALNIARKTDCMVVVGGKASGNTRRLAEIVEEQGIPAVIVETAADLDRKFFHGHSTVGLTAGASTPKDLVNSVEQQLLEW